MSVEIVGNGYTLQELQKTYQLDINTLTCLTFPKRLPVH